MEAEMDDHLGYEKSERVDSNEVSNYRNDTKKKQVNSSLHSFLIPLPEYQNANHLVQFSTTTQIHHYHQLFFPNPQLNSNLLRSN